MTQAQQGKTITLTSEQLAAMEPADLVSLIVGAVEIRATAVVRRADGTIRYDVPERAGSYGEQYLREGGTDGG